MYFESVVGWRDFMLREVVDFDVYVWMLLIEDDDDFGVVYLLVMWDNCFFLFFVI